MDSPVSVGRMKHFRSTQGVIKPQQSLSSTTLRTHVAFHESVNWDANGVFSLQSIDHKHFTFSISILFLYIYI